jgi:hypothetical protein
MLIRRAELKGIQRGEVTLAFRRWPRPRVVAGSRLRTAVGVLAVRSLEEVELDAITEADALAAGQPSLAALLDFLRSRAGTIYRIGLAYAGEDPRAELRRRATLSADEVAGLVARLERMGRPGGGWPIAYLRLIGASPHVHAAILAEGLGLETQAFKRRVRQLKELGLTESLRPGYRLSPRGQALLDAIGQAAG